MQNLFENWRFWTNEAKTSEPEHGYVVGNLDGKVFVAENENQLFWGASMNKPLVALAQLIYYKNDKEKKLTDKELKGLLAYTGYESNDVNRILSNFTPRKPDLQKIMSKMKNKEMAKKSYDRQLKKYNYLVRRRKKIGKITPEIALDFLKKYGLDTKMLIRYGSDNNQQSAMGFFKFLEFLHDAKRISGIEKEVKIIIDHMKRQATGTSRKDREAKKWKRLQKYLNDQGIAVYNIYGKGGRIPKKHLHYGFVINNDIVLSIYTASDDIKFLYPKVAQILKASGQF